MLFRKTFTFVYLCESQYFQIKKKPDIAIDLLSAFFRDALKK